MHMHKKYILMHQNIICRFSYQQLKILILLLLILEESKIEDFIFNCSPIAKLQNTMNLIRKPMNDNPTHSQFNKHVHVI